MRPDTGFWKDKQVCVTGGTGLLGYQVVCQLLEAGARVRVFALPPNDRHPIRREPRVSLAFGDIRELALVRSALQDCEVVFHVAGVVAVWGPALRRVRDVHAIGTSNVLASAEKNARVVLTSSVVTIGASLDMRLLDEESEFNLQETKIDYIHAKREAERIAFEHAARGQDVVVANPGYLVGPEDFERSVMGRFCIRYWRGMIPIAPPGGFNLVDVRDVAIGHLLAAEQGQAGRRYILGGENHSLAGFMNQLAKVVGFHPRATPVLPWWGLNALANAGEMRAFMTRRHPYPSIQHARLNRYYWFYSSERARMELGYASRPLSDSLHDTFRWFSSVKTLKPRGASRWWMRPDSSTDRAA